MAHTSKRGKPRAKKNPQTLEEVIIVRSGEPDSADLCAVGFLDTAEVCGMFVTDCQKNDWAIWRVEQGRGAVTYVFPAGEWMPE